ncbi:MAG: alpha-glucosidase, partial [Leptospiraceae bacterium]|nr:alpha-glucosidase [Leptospiraceae bacterium]
MRITIALAVFAIACGEPLFVKTNIPAELRAGNLLIRHRDHQLHFIDQRLNQGFLRLDLKQSFVTARRARDAVRAHLASYHMHETVLEHCPMKELTGMQSLPEGVLLSGNLDCAGNKSAVDITITAEKNLWQLRIVPKEPRFNRIIFHFMAEPDEHIFGGGEQFTHLDLRGFRVPLLSEEQGVGRGAQPITAGAHIMAGAGGNAFTTYAPIPFFFSSAFRAFENAQTAYQIWDFHGDRYRVEIWDNTLVLYFSAAQSYSEILKDYTARHGRMQPLPDWALGTILGVQGGRERVEKILAEALAAGNPVTAIWIQDWVGRRFTSFGSQLWWRWLPDEQSYPDFRNWVAGLRKRGIRVLGYINPFLADSGPIFEEALRQGYLVRNQQGEPYRIQTAGFPAYLVDLSNPLARDFLKNIIRKNLLGNGLSGYMADFGEWLPWDAVLYSGESAALWHNRYPVEWAKLNGEAIREARMEKEVVFFTRAGFTDAARYSPLFWLGDQLVSFDQYDGLASAITGLLSGGISGITLNHSDIGGYTTINN